MSRRPPLLALHRRTLASSASSQPLLRAASQRPPFRTNAPPEKPFPDTRPRFTPPERPFADPRPPPRFSSSPSRPPPFESHSAALRPRGLALPTNFPTFSPLAPLQPSVPATAKPAPSAKSAVALPDRPLSVMELSRLTSCAPAKLFGKLMELDSSTNLPARVREQLQGGRRMRAMGQAAESLILPADTCELLLLELNVAFRRSTAAPRLARTTATSASTPRRAPIVTTMGHVDHGKTTLLDALRRTSVAQNEKGGITQRVSAFKVALGNKTEVTFLDTPGHEAFAAMRANGAAVTDVVLVCVAATDGPMPQTREAVTLARAASLPCVFALTKTDLVSAERAAQVADLLVSEGLKLEDEFVVKCASTKRAGLEDLVEALMMQAELSGPPRAEPDAPGEAVVLESRVDRALGPLADVVVRWGTLRVGDCLAGGGTWGRVRHMVGADGKAVTSAGPSEPVTLAGLDESPTPGSDLLGVADEATAKRELLAWRERQGVTAAAAVSGTGEDKRKGKDVDRIRLSRSDKTRECVPLALVDSPGRDADI